MHRLAGKDPAHMRPPCAIDGRMRIAFFVGELMMNAVRGHPENRSAFERQRGAPSQEIFDPSRRLVAAMREQTVIAHADAETARNPPQEAGDEKCRPSKEKQRGYGADMKPGHGNRRDPVKAIFFCILL